MRSFKLFVPLALALSLFACSGGKEDKRPARRPAPVSAAKAELSQLPARIEAVGNVEPYQSVAVRTQVGGLIVEQRVRDGQEVAAGDVLYVLDQRPFQAALKEGQGKLERDQALLKKAEDDLTRYTGLKQKDVVSQQQYDQASTDAKSLRASIKLSEAAIEQARLQLDYSVIKAPFAGRVGSVLVHQGNVIKANDDRNLLIINQIQPIYVSFAVPEQHLPEIASRLDGKAPLEVLAFVGGDEMNAERGTLAAVDNAVDRTTGTIRLKGMFQNAGKRLWPGQFARVALNLSDRDNVLTVPAQAVQQGLQGAYVYVVTGQNTVEFRLVETGATTGERVSILKGVTAGETVVTDGHVRLAPGAPVEIKGAGAPAVGGKPGNAPAGGKPGEGAQAAGEKKQ
jgi:multidrug efflux system membrane fusion protein